MTRVVGRVLTLINHKGRRVAPEAEARAPTGERSSIPHFTVATWNIHSCVGLDARFQPARVAAIINELNADVIGLQEVGWHHRGETGFDQFRYLAERTGCHLALAPTKDGPHGHFGNALLSRRPLVHWHAFDLTLPGKEPRSGVDAVIDVDGHPLRVIVAHLGLTPWERARQYRDLVQRVERQPSTPTVLMGDFNEWATRAPRLKTLARRFPDHASPPSFPASLPGLRLDRVYVGGGARLLGAEAIRRVPAFRASDHLPVRAWITLPESEIPMI